MEPDDELIAAVAELEPGGRLLQAERLVGGVSATVLRLTEWIDGSTTLAEQELVAALDLMAGFLTRLHALAPGILAPHLEPIENPATGALRFLPATDVGETARQALSQSGIPPLNPRAILHG